MMSRAWFRWLQGGLLVLGVLLLASWSRTESESRAFQSGESKKLEAAVESEGVLGRIEIPRLGIRAMVAEGTDENTLRHAVGHIPSTASPGSPGNCALAGHRDTFLRGLGGVRVNDVVRVVTLDSTYTYRVEWIRVVEPQRVDVLDTTAARSLTLVTCYPFAFVGHAPRRFIVRARQVEPITSLRSE